MGLPVLPKAAHLFVDGVQDRKVKQNLLRGGERPLNETLNQALRQETAKAAKSEVERSDDGACRNAIYNT